MTALCPKREPFSIRLQDAFFHRMMSFFWSIRHPRAKFCEDLCPVPDRIIYQSSDGCRTTVSRYPHTQGRGEPLILATGPLIHPRILRLGQASFLKELQKQGFTIVNKKEDKK